jgi:hypothetical protein
MKVYINYFNLELLPNFLNLFAKYLIKSKIFIQIYSIDGSYVVDTVKTTKQKCVDVDIEIFNNYFENYELIVDKSYFIEESTNYINSEHISSKIKKHVFEINKNSNVNLIIECELINTDTTTSLVEMIPNNIYFEISNNNLNINDPTIKKEIIGFLSLFN